MDIVLNAGLLSATFMALGLLATALFRLDGKIDSKIDGLGARIDARFDRVDTRFDHVESRLSTLEARLTDHIQHPHS